MPATDSASLPHNSAPRSRLFGVSAALVTPFRKDGSLDSDRAAMHGAQVIEDGADGLTLFGTTGEGASLGLTDRAVLLQSMLDGGVPSDRMTAGIAACDIETAEAQARLALDRGVSRLLLAPPFYFKDVDDMALFDWVAQFMQKVGDGDLKIILYHIPQVTAVRFDAPLIRRLKDKFSDAIFGVKDSEGDRDHVSKMLKMDDLAVLVGDERMLARAAPLGGAGTISGMANLAPGRIAAMVHTGTPDVEMDALVDRVVAVPVTPMVKALVGRMRGDDAWDRTRPPLRPADPKIVDELATCLTALT